MGRIRAGPSRLVTYEGRVTSLISIMAATTARSRPGGPTEYIVINVIEDGEVTDEDYERELDRALEDGAEMIVIEPATLGDETARWIKVGNCLHKTCVVSGALGLIGQTLDDKRRFLYISFGVASVICASVYAISWQNDPCCKYQVEMNVPKLEKILPSLNSATPVVLVKKDDGRRKKLHNFIAVLSGILCAWKIYGWIQS